MPCHFSHPQGLLSLAGASPSNDYFLHVLLLAWPVSILTPLLSKTSPVHSHFLWEAFSDGPPCDSEVATAASISPVPRDPQRHPGLTCTCCYNFVGCGYLWRCTFVFYFTVRFSTCSSRSQVSPSDQKLMPALDTIAHSNQHPRLPYPACMSVSCLSDWESLKTVLFSSVSPLPAHNLSVGMQRWLSPRSAGWGASEEL